MHTAHRYIIRLWRKDCNSRSRSRFPTSADERRCEVRDRALIGFRGAEYIRDTCSRLHIFRISDALLIIVLLFASTIRDRLHDRCAYTHGERISLAGRQVGGNVKRKIGIVCSDETANCQREIRAIRARAHAYASKCERVSRPTNDGVKICYPAVHYGCVRVINYFHVPRHAETSHDLGVRLGLRLGRRPRAVNLRRELRRTPFDIERPC